MNKPLIVLASAVIALTACSKNAEKATDTNNNQSQSESIQEPVATKKKDTDSTTADSNVTTDSEVIELANKPEEKSDKVTDTKQSEQAPVSSESSQSKEMVILLQTLDGIAQEAMAKQGEINQKMQEASSREEDDAISQMTIDLLKKQQQKLKSVSLTDAKLVEIRDKLVKSTDIGIEANQEMISIRQPTAEDEQTLVAKFTEGRKLSDEAKSELMQLVQANTQ